MPLDTVGAVCSAIITELDTIAELKSVPAAPPEQAADFPFVVVVPGTAKVKGNTPEDFRMLVDIDIEMHVNRKDLPTDVTAAVALYEPILNALYAVLKDDTTAHGDITVSRLQAMSWGGIDTIGFVFTVNEVKILKAVT